MRQVRSSHSRQNNFESNNSKIWWIVGIVIVVFIIFKFFVGWNSTWNTQQTGDFITITPDEKSIIAIADKNLRETTLNWTGSQKLFTTDGYILVSEGSAKAKVKSSYIDLDEKTQISYISSNIDSESLKLEKWRAWVESIWNSNEIELKRMTVKIPSGSIAMIEQTNTAFSVAYAISGNIEISTIIGQYTLKAGEWIKLSDSNLTSEKTKLSDLVDAIDASIVNNTVFIRNNWEEILKNTTKTEETEQQTENSSTWTTENSINPKYISFTQPTNNLNSKTDTINIMGTILEDDVSRVTINDLDTIISPVNQSFSLQNFKLNSEINNIVYKVYNSNWIQLEIGVIVVYGPKNTGTQTTIVPQNYPINSDSFKIINKNPLATTDSYVRVEWTVPKNTVEYITVNDYRLQKFLPNTEKWYYHANADIGTIKEWTNLYYIKFFDKNNNLLYTQLFTIIKDSKSNTNTNENSSLFPS